LRLGRELVEDPQESERILTRYADALYRGRLRCWSWTVPNTQVVNAFFVVGEVVVKAIRPVADAAYVQPKLP
jgi:hypothetical protein